MAKYRIDIPGEGSFMVESPTELTNEQAIQAVQLQLSPDMLRREQEELAGGKLDTMYQQGMQGATFRFGDEIQAAIAAPYAKAFGGDATKDMSLPELYVQARDELRAKHDAQYAVHPKTAFLSELGGGLVTGGKVGKSIYQGTKGVVANPYGRTAVAAAIPSGWYGAGASEAPVVTEGGINPAGLAEQTADASGAAGVGAALGVGMQKVLNIVAPKVVNIIARMRGANRPVVLYDEAGNITDDAIEATRELARRGEISPEDADAFIRYRPAQNVLGPDELTNAQTMQRAGVTPHRANVTQSTDDWKRVQEAAKSSGKVADVITGQSDEIAARARTVGEAIGGTADDVNSISRETYNTLYSARNQIDDVVKEAYDTARKSASGKYAKLSNFARTLQRYRGEKQTSGGILEAAKAILEDKGLIKAGAKFSLRKRDSNLDDKLKSLAANEMYQVRVALNDLYASANPRGRAIIRALTNAIDDDMVDAVGQNVFERATRLKHAERQLLEKATGKYGKRGTSFIQKIFDESIPPDQIFSRMRSESVEGLSGLRRYLMSLDKLNNNNAGSLAWDSLRAQHIHQAIEKALGTAAKGEGGTRVWNPNLFRNYFKPFREKGTFKMMFNSAEQEMINEIEKIGRLIQPIGRVQQGMGPTAQAVESGIDAVLARLPVIGRAQGLRRALMNWRENKALTENILRPTERALNAGVPQ